MKVRITPSHDENLLPLFWVEIKPDTWIETNRVPTDTEYTKMLADIAAEKENNVHRMTYHTRSFSIMDGLKEWREIEITKGWE